MRRYYCVALLGAIGWLAQATLARAVDQTQTGPNPSGCMEHRKGHAGIDSTLRGSEIIGMRVRNAAGENLGDVKDLVMDLSSGKVRYATLSFGGFLGIGDKLFAVPWDDLRLVGRDASDQHFVLNVEKKALEAAPGFPKDQWPSFADKNWTDKIDKFYEQHRTAQHGTDMRR